MARSGDLGWAGSGIWVRGEGLETSQKSENLGRKWVETEDEGKSSCEKLQVVLAVLLVVAVCQNTLQKFKSMQKYRKPDFRTSGIYSEQTTSVADRCCLRRVESSKIEVLDFLSLCGIRSLPPAG